MSVIFTPTIHHSGSNFIRHCVGPDYVKWRPNRKVPITRAVDQQITAHFIAYEDGYMPQYIALANNPNVKTVIPLRHPALIAVSHKKRHEESGAHFLYKWILMCQIPNAFYFPIETMPFDELEAFLRKKVSRNRKPMRTLGDYPEKRSLDAAKTFLKDDWWAVGAALNTDIGRRYYGSG